MSQHSELTELTDAGTPPAGSAAQGGGAQGGATGVSGSASGSATSGSGSVFGLPMEDYLYSQGITVTPRQEGKGLEALGLKKTGNGTNTYIINNNTGGDPSILINSGRVVINSKTSQTIIAGANGVAITSPDRVNIDADNSVIVFGYEGTYLGVPNKGNEVQPYPPKDIPEASFFKDGKKLKSYPAPDNPYEPAVLGLKLVNWLDDLLVVLKYQQNLTSVGYSTAREDTQWDFMVLRDRLPELISTAIFLDGYSHEMPDFKNIPPPPKEVTKPQTSININATVTETAALGTNTEPGAVINPVASKPGYYNAPDVQLPTVKP